MAAKNTNDLLVDIAALILSGGKRTTAENVRVLLGEFLVSYPNVVDGGSLFQNTIGYAGGYRPTDPSAFATVDMINSGGNITSQIWITATPSPVDGFYHKIKVTMGVDLQFQYVDLGAV